MLSTNTDGQVDCTVMLAIIHECYNAIEPYAQNTDIGFLCKQTQIDKFLASTLSKTELVASTENFGHLADTE